MAVVNRNYMDLGDYPSKPVSNKPLYTKPYVNNLVSSAVIGATAGTSSATNSGSRASGAGSGSSGYTVPSAESSYASALQDYYDKMEAQLRRQEREAEKKMKAQVEQGVNTLESQKPALGQQFQDSAQQAYIRYMQAQKALPQMMAARGLSGGASESSLAGLEANYGSNVNALQNSYNQALNSIDADIANLRASGDISLAENASDYSRKLYELAAQQQADQLALLKKAGSAVGSSDSTPRLSYAQALNLLNSGVYSPEAMDVYRNATGVDYVPTLSEEGRAFADGMENNLATNYSSRFWNQDQILEQIAEAIQSQLDSGRITQQDAAILAQKYGINVG